MQKKYDYWLFVLPSLLLIGIVIIIPFLIGIYYSFTNSNGISATWIGLKNYILLFNDANFLQSCALTLLFSLLSIVGINLIALSFALLVTHRNNRLNRLLRTIFFIPNLIGGILLGFIWQFIFVQVFGAIGSQLHLFFFQRLAQFADDRSMGTGHSFLVANERLCHADLYCIFERYPDQHDRIGSIGWC